MIRVRVSGSGIGSMGPDANLVKSGFDMINDTNPSWDVRIEQPFKPFATFFYTENMPPSAEELRVALTDFFIGYTVVIAP